MRYGLVGCQASTAYRRLVGLIRLSVHNIEAEIAVNRLVLRHVRLTLLIDRFLPIRACTMPRVAAATTLGLRRNVGTNRGMSRVDGHIRPVCAVNGGRYLRPRHRSSACLP